MRNIHPRSPVAVRLINGAKKLSYRGQCDVAGLNRLRLTAAAAAAARRTVGEA